MSKKRRNSKLQKEIVALLKEEPGLKVVEISKKLERQRPSISRSLKNLKERDIVVLDNNGYKLKSALAPNKIPLLDAQKELTQALTKLTQLPKINVPNLAPMIEFQQSIAKSMIPLVKFQQADAISKSYVKYLKQINIGFSFQMTK